jgi:hypothetical protein
MKEKGRGRPTEKRARETDAHQRLPRSHEHRHLHCFRDLLLGTSGDLPQFTNGQTISPKDASNDWYDRAHNYITLNARHIMWGTIEGLAGGMGRGIPQNGLVLFFLLLLLLMALEELT